jgi:hypothetical protein
LDPLEARFSSPIQTGRGAHPAFYTTGAGVFLVVKWPEIGFNHESPPNLGFKEIVELYFYSFTVPLWQIILRILTFTLLLRAPLMEVKQSGREANHLSPYNAEIKELHLHNYSLMARTLMACGD